MTATSDWPRGSVNWSKAGTNKHFYMAANTSCAATDNKKTENMMNTETQETKGGIRLDTQTLEGRSLHLPESMREPFVWLGSYCREECNRNVEMLYDRFAAIGFNHDKTTWGKILRGLWNRDAAGNETPSPCLAEEKFLKAVNALRSNARIKELGGRIPFIMTPTARRIHTYIDIKRAPDRINKFGVIIGPTGSQKSAATDEYQRRNNHGMVIKVESPETPNMNQFMTDLARCYGHNSQDSYLRKKAYVLSLVNSRRTIIVENVQRLYDQRQGDRQAIFSFLQKLQEDTGCTVVLTLTPVFEKTLLDGFQRGFFEQFEGRAGGRKNFLRLPDYPEDEDVLAIAKAFGLVDAEDHVAELVKLARQPGRIRLLFEVFQDAKIEVGNRKLTIDHIRDAAGD